MDKQLTIIIIFLAIMFTLAGVLVMGAVPKIFQTSETANETKVETQNQTEIILKQFQRENNTTQRVLSNQGVVIDKLDKSLSNQHLMLLGINTTISQNHNDLAQNLNVSRQNQNISKQHQIVAIDHDKLQVKVDNMTQDIYDLLEEADKRNFNATMTNKVILNNLTKELKEIKSLHKEILKELKTLN
jgi:hypothetical protein